MYCPFCRNKNTKVIDKRDNEETNTTRRRRECDNCGKRFTSYERIEKVILNVKKKDGSVQEFDRNKLKLSILKGLKKRKVITDEKIEDLVSDIEHSLLSQDMTTIDSLKIGEMVLKRLTKLDKLGALLFAAVYKDFKTLEDVENELDRLSN